MPLLLFAIALVATLALGPLRGLLLVTAVWLLVYAVPAFASPPPDPHPSAAAGRIRWEPYVYLTKDRRDGWPVVCYVPVIEPRVCWRVP